MNFQPNLNLAFFYLPIFYFVILFHFAHLLLFFFFSSLHFSSYNVKRTGDYLSAITNAIRGPGPKLKSTHCNCLAAYTILGNVSLSGSDEVWLCMSVRQNAEQTSVRFLYADEIETRSVIEIYESRARSRALEIAEHFSCLIFDASRLNMCPLFAWYDC